MRLTHFSGPLAGTPRWSPDGKEIAFDGRPNRQADILVMPSAGGDYRHVTTDPSEDVVPSWSRDGKWIYFASNRSGAFQVWRAHPDGSDKEQVTRLGGFAAFESPDGRYLYYAKGRDAQGLWRKRLPEGAEELVLDQLKPGFWGSWGVVEDGIYFVDRPQRGQPLGIFFYRFSNKSINKIWTFERIGAISDSAFSVSPDRRFILFTQIDLSGSDIFLMDHFR